MNEAVAVAPSKVDILCRECSGEGCRECGFSGLEPCPVCVDSWRPGGCPYCDEEGCMLCEYTGACPQCGVSQDAGAEER